MTLRYAFSRLLSKLTRRTTEPVINKAIRPGKVWRDREGAPINAHGGGVLHHQGTYYWYGEYKKGATRLVPNQEWECYRVEAGGVSCYASEDLLNWIFCGLALPANTTDPTHDLHTSRVIERPKVIYNAPTNKFVMWLHVDADDYTYARAGVAVSDSPTGPFQYLGSCRPNGQMSRDMTLFQDDDGSAYQIASSEDNETLHINQLSADYLRPSGISKRILIGQSREAPALFKYRERYYLITSGCTGWTPNPASWAEATSVLGKWQECDNPCVGPNAERTFGAQGTFVVPIAGQPDQFIFMADRWNKTNLEDSRYVWLPLTMQTLTGTNPRPVIQWQDKWTPVQKID